MHWHTWRYWLRGGVIAGGITFLSFLLFYSCGLANFNNSAPESWACLPLLVVSPMFPFAILMETDPLFHSLPTDDLPTISIVAWFIIGSLIGAVVDYMKSRKRHNR